MGSHYTCQDRFSAVAYLSSCFGRYPVAWNDSFLIGRGLSLPVPGDTNPTRESKEAQRHPHQSHAMHPWPASVFLVMELPPPQCKYLVIRAASLTTRLGGWGYPPSHVHSAYILIGGCRDLLMPSSVGKQWIIFISSINSHAVSNPSSSAPPGVLHRACWSRSSLQRDGEQPHRSE